MHIPFPATASHSPVKINFSTGKCYFLHGDQWVEIGPVFYCSPACRGHVHPLMLGEFLNSRQAQDDSTMDWFRWGPNLN